MNEVFMMQPNSALFYLSESMCSLDVKTILKCPNRSPAVQITGKKIVSSIKLPISGREKSPPSKIFIKKSPERTSPLSQKPPIHSKLRKNSAKELKQNKNGKKTPNSLKKLLLPVPIKIKPTKSQNLSRVPLSVKEKPPEKNFAASSMLRSKFKHLIKLSLKRQHMKNIRKAKEKRGQAEMKDIKKQEILYKNIQIRKENTRFKKMKLSHKHCWGVDQSRIREQRVNRESPDKKGSRKTKSTERVRTGLDAIKEIQLELGKVHAHSRTLSQGSEKIGIHRKRHFESNGKLSEFMKINESNRKEKVINENLKKFSEDSRKEIQRNRLEQIGKEVKTKHKHKKNRKKDAKSRKFTENSEKEAKTEFKDLTLAYESIPPASFAKANSSRSEASKFYPEAKEKPAVQEHSLEILSKPMNPVYKFDVRNSAAIKIQAHIRRFLVQRKIEKDPEYPSADEQVKSILERKAGVKSSSTPEDLSVKESLSPIKPLQIETLSSAKSGRSLSCFCQSPNAQDSERLAQEFEVKKIEYQEKLKEQLLLREGQLQSLGCLRQKEMEDIQKITRTVMKNEDLANVLSEVIDKRYNQLSTFFAESAKSIENSLLNEMNAEEKEEFASELDNKRQEISKLLKNAEKKEESLTKIKCISKLDIEEDPPTIYQPSVIVNDPVEENEIPQVHEMPNQVPRDSIIQESTINKLSSDEDIQESLYILVDDFQVSTPSPSNSHRKIENFSSPNQAEIPIEKTEQILIEDSSLELSSSFGNQISNTSEPFKLDTCTSNTPEYPLDRPSSPLNYLDIERKSPEAGTSPHVLNEVQAYAEEFSDIEWLSNIAVEMTPELVVILAEDVLMKLIEEDPSFLGHQLSFLNIGNADEFRVLTDPLSIKQYVEDLLVHCKVDEIAGNIKEPLKINPIDMLAKLQELEIGSIVDNEFHVFPDIISVNVYISLERQYKNSLNDKIAKAPGQVGRVLIEAEHIHHKLIFDATNEALQKHRPHGLSGLPMPWIRNIRGSAAVKPVHQIFVEAKETVYKWSSIQAGKVCSNELVLSTGMFDEELLQEIREKRLTSMISAEIMENDEMWVNYDFEEAQAKIDMAEILLDNLCEEIINALA